MLRDIRSSLLIGQFEKDQNPPFEIDGFLPHRIDLRRLAGSLRVPATGRSSDAFKILIGPADMEVLASWVPHYFPARAGWHDRTWPWLPPGVLPSRTAWEIFRFPDDRLVRRYLGSILPTGDQVRTDCSEHGQPRDSDRVPGGNKERRILRAVGHKDRGGYSPCKHPTNRACKRWPRRRAMTQDRQEKWLAGRFRLSIWRPSKPNWSCPSASPTRYPEEARKVR